MIGSSVPTTSLQLVGVAPRALAAYRGIVEDALVDEIDLLKQNLRGVRLLHLNATAFGGGVAELLNSLVPLEQDCGLQVEWRVVCPDEQLFTVTKGFPNALQGQPSNLDQWGEDIYLRHNAHCASMLAADAYDVVIVHDPQPAAIPRLAAPNRTTWIWRCHIDSSAPDARVWNFLRPYIERYDAAVFTMGQFVPADLHGPVLSFIPPAIDPLSARRHISAPPRPRSASRGAARRPGSRPECAQWRLG